MTTPPRPTPFRGIPAEAFDFFDALAADNSKPFWLAHKDDWQRTVREPLVALCGQLADEFGDAHLYRPYRDVRFSRDKSPYKTLYGVSTRREPLTCGDGRVPVGFVGVWGVAGRQFTDVSGGTA